MRNFSVKNRAVILLSFLILPQQLLALVLTGNVSSDTSYTNNSRLQSTSKLDDVVQTTGLNVTVKEDRKNFQTDVTASLTSEKYLNNTFSDLTTLATGLGVLNFDIIESFLNWNTFFSRNEVLIDSAESDTPDNREVRNILRTGPAITYAISRNSTLGMSANYINVENEDEEISDSESLFGKLRYTYVYNPLTRLQFSSDYATVLDGDGDDEYDRLSFNAGFIRTIVNGEVVVRYTLSQFKSEVSPSEHTNSYYFSFNRMNLFFHDFLFVYQQKITDGSLGDGSDNEEASDDPDEIISGKGIIKHDQISVDASRTLGSFNYSVNGFWERQSTLGSDIVLVSGSGEPTKNRELSMGGSVRLGLQYSPFISLGFGAEFQVDDFIDRPTLGKDVTNTYSFDAEYSVSKDLSLNTYVSFMSRSNNKDGAREYERFSTGFGLVWKFF